MHRAVVSAVLAASFFVVSPARADKPIVTAVQEGQDLKVTVQGVTDYCVTHADTEIVRGDGAIRIVRGRPSRVSRCFVTREMTFVIPNVPAGTYTVSYEQIPLVAPARALKIAQTTAIIGL
jgi:hypothetical protein